MSTELPPGWSNIRAQDVFGFITSGSRGWAKHYSSSGAAFIRVQNVRRGDINLDLEDVQRITPPLDIEGTRTRLRLGDIAITITADLGRVGLIRSDIGDAYVNQHVALARPVNVDMSGYLAWFFSSPVAQEQLGLLDRGVTRAGLGLKDIAAVSIPLPPLAEQRRIVARIEALFARTRRARADLERVAPLATRYFERLLTKGMTGELTEPWRAAGCHGETMGQKLSAVRRARRPDARLARRVAAENPPDEPLPATWAWVSPDEIADDARYSVAIGPFGSNLVRSDYRESGVRLVFVRDIMRGSFDDDKARYVTVEKAAELHQHIVRSGDVLITKMGEPPDDTTLFPNGMESGIITSDCIKLTPHKDLARSDFLALCIRAPLVRRQIEEITKGVAQQKVSLENFRQIALPVPPLEEQEQIITRIGRQFAAMDRVTQDAIRSLALLDHLEQSILAHAFRGELVPQDPNDEPASVALAGVEQKASIMPGRGRPRRAA